MPDFSHLMGWVDDQDKVNTVLSKAKMPYMSSYQQNICGAGAGKKSDNVSIIKSIHGGKFPIIVQETSDCVSFGLAGAINALKCIRKFQGKYEEFGGFTSTEDIYGGSRILIGKGQLGRGGGSVGTWAAEYVTKYGTLVRKKYGNIDLSTYSGARADDWGIRGVPKELLPFAEEHQVRNYSQILTWEEFRDAIYSGYPVTVASNRGFSGQRDKDGFLMGRASWPHLVYFIDVQDGSRPGGLLVNSWPVSWVSGVERDDTPPGCGWVPAEVIVRDMLSNRDSYCYTDYEGYPAQNINWEVAKLAVEKLKTFKGKEF